jgi:hypothetical protein
LLVRVLAMVGVIAWCGVASAQSVLRRPALHWARSQDALSCVDPRTLAERVEELVGPVLVRAPEAEHTVEAEVSRPKPDALRVEVRVLNVWGAKVGERTFEQQGGDCAELTPAIAFVIAMMIDPDVAAHGLPPALIALLGGDEPAEEKLMREVDGAAPEPPLPAMPPPPPPKPTVAQRRDPELPKPPPPRGAPRQAALLVRGSWHEAARATFGIEGRYLQRAWSEHFSAGGYIRIGQQPGAATLPDDRFLSITTLDVGLQACGGQSALATLRVMMCLGFEVTNAIGRGDGFSRDHVQGVSTGAAVAQLTARLRLVGQFGVMLSFNARAAFSQREFDYRDAIGRAIPVLKLPILAGGIALGPSYEF